MMPRCAVTERALTYIFRMAARVYSPIERNPLSASSAEQEEAILSICYVADKALVRSPSAGSSANWFQQRKVINHVN
jgi:hypothetical protein